MAAGGARRRAPRCTTCRSITCGCREYRGDDANAIRRPGRGDSVRGRSTRPGLLRDRPRLAVGAGTVASWAALAFITPRTVGEIARASREQDSVDGQVAGKASVVMSMTDSTMMLTLDGSAFAEQAIEPTRELALALGSKVVILDVLPQRRGPSPFSIEAARRADRREASKHLERAKARLIDAGVHDVEIVQVEGASPADVIVDSVNRLACGVVVMATHGRSGLRRTLRGSTCEQVVRRLPAVPVLLVHVTAA